MLESKLILFILVAIYEDLTHDYPGTPDQSMVLDEDEFNKLQGASCTVGGIFRGKAVGNYPAFADMESGTGETVQQSKGRVFLHVGEDTAPFAMTHPVGSDLPSVLNGLSKLYSPIKHQNARICVKEEGIWTLKGRFSTAVRMAEELPWIKDDKGKWSVTLQAETIPSGPAGNAGPVSLSALLPSALPESDDSGFSHTLQTQLMSLLNIPKSLTVRGRNLDIRLAYAKYKATHQALDDMHRMKIEGTWPLGNINTRAVIEVFVSKSTWHAYYDPLFSRSLKYPPLVKWLENAPDANPAHEVWGEEKTSYSLEDLSRLLDYLDKRAQVTMSTKKKKEKKRKYKDSEQEVMGDSGSSSKKDGSSSKKHKRAKSFDDTLM